MDWDAGIWRYCNNDNIIKIIKNNYVVLNLGEDDLFILIFFKKVEEGNNNFDIDINYFFIKVFAISPLPLKYREYTDIFSKSKARQLPNHILIKHTINTENVKSLYKFIYNLLINEFNIFRDNLKEFLEKGYI